MTTGVDLPAISVWQPLGTQYARVGDIRAALSYKFTPTFLAVGDWELTLLDDEAAEVITPSCLLTTDWRGERYTWCVSSITLATDEETGELVLDEETGLPILIVAGVGALSFLNREEAWPDPTKPYTDAGANAQPVINPTDPAPYNSNAETVVRSIVLANLRTRYGLALSSPVSQNRGTTVVARPQFENLMELVTGLASDGGIGVDVGLVNETDMRANLTLLIWQPADLTGSVPLTADSGAVKGVKQVKTEPTLTKAIVSGAGEGVSRFKTIVTTAKSEAAALEWGGHRVAMVDGPSTFDLGELRQAGRQAIRDGASTLTMEFTVAESEGTRAFRDYKPGDQVAAQPFADSLPVMDDITSATFSLGDEGIDVDVVIGNPSATDAQLDLAAQIGDLKRKARHLERK